MKKETIGKVGGIQTVINSPGKLNKSMDIVKTGCGSHKSPKDYDRKREKRNLKKELSEYRKGIKAI